MTTHATQLRRGFTLVELVVVLAILATFAGLAFTGFPPRRPLDARQRVLTEISDLRGRAIQVREVQRAWIVVDDTTRLVTALPDGSVVADSLLGVSRFGGRSADARP